MLAYFDMQCILEKIQIFHVIYIYNVNFVSCEKKLSDRGGGGGGVIGVFNLCQHFKISYSRYANKHFITGVYITINDSYR